MRGARLTEREVKIEAPWRIAVRRCSRHRMALVSLVVLAIICIVAIGAPVIVQHDPAAIDLRARCVSRM